MNRVDTILSKTASSFGVTVDDLRSRSKKKSTALARQVCMYLLVQVTNMSGSDVARFFGRSPATVSYAYQKIAVLKHDEAWLDEIVTQVIHKLGGIVPRDLPTSDIRAAYINTQSVSALIEMNAMVAENRWREVQQEPPAYGEEAFMELMDKYVISSDAVVSLIGVE